MNLRTLFLNACILISISSLAIGYAKDSHWLLIAILAILGFLWLIGCRYNWNIGSILFTILVMASALGFSLNAPEIWMIIGTISALAAWDLNHFTRSLTMVEQVERIDQLEKEHLFRLSTIVLFGFLLSIFSLYISIRLAFGWTLLLAIFAIIAASQLLHLFNSLR